MSAKRIDRSGQRYGLWTVLEFDSRYGASGSKWLCQCDCGTRKSVIYRSLQSGSSKSCGCVSSVLRSKKTTKHGMAGTPTYKSWHQMHRRCKGKHGHDYYVANSITVCQRWDSFENFYEDMGERPSGTTLDRIDGSLGYLPGNCRWANVYEQANNKKTSRKEEVFGKLLSVAEAARAFGCGISKVRHRLRKGWSLQDAVTVL